MRKWWTWPQSIFQVWHEDNTKVTVNWRTGFRCWWAPPLNMGIIWIILQCESHLPSHLKDENKKRIQIIIIATSAFFLNFLDSEKRRQIIRWGSRQEDERSSSVVFRSFGNCTSFTNPDVAFVFPPDGKEWGTGPRGLLYMHRSVMTLCCRERHLETVLM